MRALPRVLGDVLLALFAVAVFIAAGMVVKSVDPPLEVTAAGGFTAQPATTAPTAEATAAPSPSGSPRAVLLLGPDLAKLGAELTRATGDQVEVETGLLTATTVVDRIPEVVVLQILAGTQTSVRTTQAINAVKDAWPTAAIVVVGPFSSADRKSATAVQTASTAAKVSFLDPVALKWRTADTTPSLSAEDLAVVSRKVAEALH